jgi:hypothetical protein
MVGWVIFLPSEFWDKILNSTRVGKMLNLKFFRKIISGSPTTSPRQFRPIKSHWVTNALAFFFIMYALFWNLGTMNIERYQPMLPSQYFWPGEFFGLVQKWGVFTNPSGEGGWFVIPGKLQDGSEVDILRKGAPLNWDKPKSVPATIPNVRWRKYLDWIAIEWSTDYRAYYGRYLCQQWNSHHRKEKTLASLRVYYLRQKILANFQKSSPEKILLWEGTCSMVDSSQPAPGPKLFL